MKDKFIEWAYMTTQGLAGAIGGGIFGVLITTDVRIEVSLLLAFAFIGIINFVAYAIRAAHSDIAEPDTDERVEQLQSELNKLHEDVREIKDLLNDKTLREERINQNKTTQVTEAKEEIISDDKQKDTEIKTE